MQILWYFRICTIFKAAATNKVYRPGKLRSDRFWKMSRSPWTHGFEVIVLHMEVTMVNDYNYAHNKTCVTSKATWGQGAKSKILACVIKSSLWLNGLLATSSVKMQLQYGIYINMNYFETLEAILTSNSLEIISWNWLGREQFLPNFT